MRQRVAGAAQPLPAVIKAQADWEIVREDKVGPRHLAVLRTKSVTLKHMWQSVDWTSSTERTWHATNDTAWTGCDADTTFVDNLVCKVGNAGGGGAAITEQKIAPKLWDDHFESDEKIDFSSSTKVHSGNGSDASVLLKWEHVLCSGTSPKGRSGHTLTILGNTGYLFGGIQAENAKTGPNNDLFMCRIQNAKFEWSKPNLDGPKPSPRWDHSATLFNENFIFYFGGSTSRRSRSNESWIFDTIVQKWVHVAHLEKQKEVPQPRSGHTSVLVADRYLYVFGGFGGGGFGRRELNDLHVLDLHDLDSLEWKRVVTKGVPPEPRSGHAACAVRERDMIICGGWNSGRQFKDVIVFNSQLSAWRTLGTTLESPRWGHVMCSVEAIPHWKVFIFGGTTAREDRSGKHENVYSNDVIIIDADEEMDSHTLALTSKGPSQPLPRTGMGFSYDFRGSRLIVCSGWADRWFDDGIFALDVGRVVGPPYTVEAVRPAVGPVTGGILCKIEGTDFINKIPIVVRFSDRRHFVDAEGEFLSDSELLCTLPNFEKSGPTEVQVRVSIKGDSFTTTHQSFRFFQVTDANQCVAFGPALINGGASGCVTLFHIVAVDKDGKVRTSGGDEFDVHITKPDGGSLPCKFVDSNTGDYVVTFEPAEEGEYLVDVAFKGTFHGVEGPLRGSPFKVTFEDHGRTECNRMDGPLVTGHLRDRIGELSKFAAVTLEGVSKKLDRDDFEGLVRMKEHLRNVKIRNDDLQMGFDVCAATLRFLSSFSIPWIEDMDEKLTQAGVVWAKVRDTAITTAVRIEPLVKAASLQLKMDLADFEEEIRTYVEEHRERKYWIHSTGHQNALNLIEESTESHKREWSRRFEEKMHIATIFDFPDLLQASESMLASVMDDMHTLRLMWDFIDRWLSWTKITESILWTDVNATKLAIEVRKLQDEMFRLPKILQKSDVFTVQLRVLRDFETICPIIGDLRSETMRPRHWTMLMDVLETRFTPPFKDPSMPLGTLLKERLIEKIDNIMDVVEVSTKEGKIEATIRRMRATWTSVAFRETSYTDVEGSTLPLLTVTPDDDALLANDRMVVEGMLASRFHKHFKEELLRWKGHLRLLRDIVQRLDSVVRIWTYLEPFFAGSEEVKKEMPIDSARFVKTDKDVKALLRRASAVKIIRKVSVEVGIVKTLEMLESNLGMCKQSLSHFLESKRQVFANLYFVSESDMLSILAKGKDPRAIIPLVTKLFRDIRTVELGEETLLNEKRYRALRWIGLVGGESVEYDPQILLEGKVERYLANMRDSVRSTIKSRIENSMRRYRKKKHTKWLVDRHKKTGRLRDPSQVTQIVVAAETTRQIEKSFKDYHLGDRTAVVSLWKVKRNRIADLTTMLGKSGEHCLTAEERMRVSSIIVQECRYRDLVRRFVEENVDEPHAFQWRYQTKVRWSESDGVVVNVADVSFDYGYDYFGLSSMRLVATALSEKIFVSSLLFLRELKTGIGLVGRSGVGKTETVKEMARTLGHDCFVVACTRDHDYRSLACIVRGIAVSGSWACLNYVTRLAPEVLSVAALHLRSVSLALRSERKEVSVDGVDIPLSPSCAFFATVVDGGPASPVRHMLPNALRLLFRPITVHRPSTEAIFEVTLTSLGFKDAPVLASKMSAFQASLATMLDDDDATADWAQVGTILRGFRIAAKDVHDGLKEGIRDANAEGIPMSDAELLLRSVRETFDPLLLNLDRHVFDKACVDAFPKLSAEIRSDEMFDSQLARASMDRHRWPDKSMLSKMKQLDVALRDNTSVVLLGSAGSGKSECWKTVARARKLDQDNVKVLHPDIYSRQRFIGRVEMTTRDWHDGLFTFALREMNENASSSENDNDSSKTEGEERSPCGSHWIVLDGEPEAGGWMENLHSVCDDRCKFLCLANNEYVDVMDHVRIIIEACDISAASPATVGRLCTVHVGLESDDDAPMWLNLVAAWVRERPERQDVKDCLQELFNTYLPSITALFEGEASGKSSLRLRAAMPGYGAVGMTSTLLKLLGGLICEENTEGRGRNAVRENLEGTFIFAAIWAFGGALRDGDRRRFSTWWRSKFSASASAKVPQRDTVFDYYLESGRKFSPWAESPFFLKNEAVDFDSRIHAADAFVVPTPWSSAVQYWSKRLLTDASGGRSVIFAGGEGVGKTTMMRTLLEARLNVDACAMTNISVSYHTDPEDLQDQLMRPLRKRAGVNIWAPPQNEDTDVEKRMMWFVDDVSAVKSVGVFELLRQFLDYGTWYTVKSSKQERSPILQKIVNCHIAACFNPDATAVSNARVARATRNFGVFGISEIDTQSLTTIFASYLSGHMKHFSPTVQAIATPLLNACVELDELVTRTFRSSPSRPMYGRCCFRGIVRVVQGILASSPKLTTEPTQLVVLWLHESKREYADVLCGDEDNEKFASLVRIILKKRFAQITLPPHLLPRPRIGKKSSFNDADDGNNENDGGTKKKRKGKGSSTKKPLIFCNAKEDPSASSGSSAVAVYAQIESLESYRSRVSEAMANYDATHNPLREFVPTNTVLRHIARVSRILKRRNGHALMIGNRGTGRKSITRLCAHMCDMQIIEFGAGERSSKSMFDILKDIFANVARRGHAACILVDEDALITEADESCFEPLCQLMSKGEVVGLLSMEEREAIIGDVSKKAKSDLRLLTVTQKQVWRWFVNEIKAKVHVVLCFLPKSLKLARVASRYAHVASCTTINRIADWSEDDAKTIAEKRMRRVADTADQKSEEEAKLESYKKFAHLRIDADEEATKRRSFRETIDPLVSVASAFFEVVHRSTTNAAKGSRSEQDMTVSAPTIATFLRTADLFASMIVERSTRLSEELARLRLALKRLKGVRKNVSKIQQTLEHLEDLQRRTAENAKKIALELTEQEAITALLRDKSDSADARCAKSRALVKRRRYQLDDELSEAEPFLMRVDDALKSVSLKGLGDIRTMSKPPKGVDVVFSALLVLFAGIVFTDGVDASGRVRDRSWKASTGRLLENVAGFLEQLKSFRARVDENKVPEINF
eukprot:g2569.t1